MRHGGDGVIDPAGVDGHREIVDPAHIGIKERKDLSWEKKMAWAKMMGITPE
jgi:hypothetical protein